jgi:uncharacterized coiled-coil protein SlyX
MTRQIDIGYRAPSTTLLEERILQLETKVALLTHAVHALTQQINEQADARSRGGP